MLATKIVEGVEGTWMRGRFLPAGGLRHLEPLGLGCQRGGILCIEPTRNVSADTVVWFSHSQIVQ